MGAGLHRTRRLIAALALIVTLAPPLLSPLPAQAQAVAQAMSEVTTIPDHPVNMSTTQLQGVSCIILGAATAAGTIFYSTTVTLASFASSWGIPLLAIPVAAGGFAVGCSVGSTTGPGLYWIYAWLSRR